MSELPIWSRARRPGNESRYDPAVAEAILGRMNAGESVRSICRDRGMPSGDTVYKWARLRPDFGVRFAEVREARRESRAWRAEQRRLGGWLTRRRNVRGGPPGSYSPALAEAVCFRLLAGKTLSEVCREPGMPAMATVYKWRRERPDFAEDYRVARRMAVEAILDETLAVAEAVTAETVAATRLKIRTLYWKAARLGPRA